MNLKMDFAFVATGLALAALFGIGCATTPPPIQTQAYAKLKSERTFEFEMPTVWKAIEASFKNQKILERDPEQVDSLEMKKLTQRSLKTDWIYTQSRDKYQQFEVNGVPRKVYVQTRIKYELGAKRSLGGTDVSVKTFEEVQKLKVDGTPADYERPDISDPSRAGELLDRIQQAILSAAP